MRLLVCVKQVPASNETRLDPVTHTIIRDGAAAVLNPFDAFAVEEAVRLKARFGGTVTALSMGIPAAEDTLRGVVAVGADEAILLTDRAFAGADTLATSRALAAAIHKAGLPDLILCGRMATDGDTAQVGPMLAERLGIPHISDVAEVESVAGGGITARKLTDDGYARVRVPLPALITVLKEINVPRLPSVGGIFRGEAAEVAQWGLGDIGLGREEAGLRGSATKVVRSERPDLTCRAETIEGAPARQAGTLIERLLRDGLIGEEARA